MVNRLNSFINCVCFVVVEQPFTRERIHNINECPATPEQWDMLINKSLSGSEFDLIVHGNKHTQENDTQTVKSV